jgi:hypothetical protein
MALALRLRIFKRAPTATCRQVGRQSLHFGATR